MLHQRTPQKKLVQESQYSSTTLPSPCPLLHDIPSSYTLLFRRDCRHSLQRPAGTAKETTNNWDLAQHVGLGDGVVSASSGRGDELARSRLLLGASRPVKIVVLVIGLLVGLVGLGSAGLLLLSFVVLVVTVLVVEAVQQLSSGLKDMLECSSLELLTVQYEPQFPQVQSPVSGPECYHAWWAVTKRKLPELGRQPGKTGSGEPWWVEYIK